MEIGPWLRHGKGQFIVGLRGNFVRRCRPPQIDANFGTLQGSTMRRNVQPLPRLVSGQHSLAGSKVINIVNMAP